MIEGSKPTERFTLERAADSPTSGEALFTRIGFEPSSAGDLPDLTAAKPLEFSGRLAQLGPNDLDRLFRAPLEADKPARIGLPAEARSAIFDPKNQDLLKYMGEFDAPSGGKSDSKISRRAVDEMLKVMGDDPKLDADQAKFRSSLKFIRDNFDKLSAVKDGKLDLESLRQEADGPKDKPLVDKKFIDLAKPAAGEGPMPMAKRFLQALDGKGPSAADMKDLSQAIKKTYASDYPDNPSMSRLSRNYSFLEGERFERTLQNISNPQLRERLRESIAHKDPPERINQYLPKATNQDRSAAREPREPATLEPPSERRAFRGEPYPRHYQTDNAQNSKHEVGEKYVGSVSVYTWSRTSRIASGEYFNPNEPTVAHKHYPFGTMLRLTNPETGDKVVVRVNNDGPHEGNRVLDLSPAAAKALGRFTNPFDRNEKLPLKGGVGFASVDVEVLSIPVGVPWRRQNRRR